MALRRSHHKAKAAAKKAKKGKGLKPAKARAYKGKKMKLRIY